MIDIFAVVNNACDNCGVKVERVQGSYRDNEYIADDEVIDGHRLVAAADKTCRQC
jgi:hypothetical protein